MKLLILGLCIFAAACSDAAVERTRLTSGSIQSPVETASNTLPDSAEVVEETLTKVASAEVDQVEKSVQNAGVVIKEEVEKVEQTSKRVCFGPNNTDCVEVQVRPKFEGTAVPQK